MRALPSHWPPALTARLSWQHGLPPLAIPLLAALTLNGVVLLPVLLQERRTPEPLALGRMAADNTPELLRFSRRQALRPGLPALTLPPGAELPPPPPLVVDLPPAAARSGGRPRAIARPSGGAGGGAPAAGKAAAASPAPASTAASEAGDAAPAAPGQEPAVEAPLIAVLLAPRRLEAAEAASVEALWNQASAALDPPAPLTPLAGGVQLRRLPLVKARALGLTNPSRQAVLTGDRPLLLWPDGATLWLLRLPA